MLVQGLPLIMRELSGASSGAAAHNEGTQWC